MSGLLHPSDLDAWRVWSRPSGPVRSLRAVLRSPHAVHCTPRPLVFRNSSEAPLIFIAVSSASPSSQAALLAPLQHLGTTSIAIASEVDLSTSLPGWSVDATDWRPLIATTRAVLGDGNYMAHGHDVWVEAVRSRIPYFVAQHGAVTPFAPPLPPSARLLAWSQADGLFWGSGRSDVQVQVTGSQLLWEAAAKSAVVTPSSRERVTYLGQGHSAEMGRRLMIEAALRFCRQHGATYRPHPSENDRLSRLTHSTFERLGITVDGSRNLNMLTGPVVSVFSTGVLEAAAQGRAAWVDFPRPPAWLQEFWERYGMQRFGDSPTPAHTPPAVEPARRIAEILERVVG